MITMRLKGGLGNQLFQYAAAYSLSKRLGQPFQFDLALTSTMTDRACKLPLLRVESSRLVDQKLLPRKIQFLKNAYVNKTVRVLNLSKHKCRDYLYWLETSDVWQSDFFTIQADNLYVDGYFQSEEYFKSYRKELINQFQPSYEAEESYIKALGRIMETNSVAVHIRRSDFKKDKNPFHYLLSEDYYKNAMGYIREHVSSPRFFLFSDDLVWVKEHLGENRDYEYINVKTTHGDIDDMMLMKNCHHIITANSTFSWWAAWLNEHKNTIRVVPDKPYGMEKMIPDGWIKVSVRGKQ